MFSLTFLTFLTRNHQKAVFSFTFLTFLTFLGSCELWEAQAEPVASPWPAKVCEAWKSQKSQKSQWKHSFLVISSQKSQWKHIVFETINWFWLVWLSFFYGFGVLGCGASYVGHGPSPNWPSSFHSRVSQTPKSQKRQTNLMKTWLLVIP